MADGSAELQIVVRAIDATRGVINAIGGRILKVLLAPLKAVGNAVKGIFKQFFSLKGLLVGGGIIGVINGLTQSLAKNAKEFEPIFSAATQDKIDKTATAFNKLGASLKKTFAELIVEFKLDEKLNALSDWLRDNQDKIIKFFKDLAAAIREAYEAAAKFFGIKGGGAAGGGGGASKTPLIDAAIKRREAEAQAAAALTSPYSGIMDRPLDFGSASRPSYNVMDEEPDPVDTAFDKLRAWEAANGRVITIMPMAAKASEGFGKAQEIVGEKVAATTKAVDAQAVAFKADTEVIERAIIATEEYADVIAGNFTDAFFDAIEGTKSFARAFGDMTVSILKDIARLFVFRSIFNAVAGALAPSAGGTGTDTVGGVGNAGTDYNPDFGRAGGGRASSSGVYSVGEQGRERVFLPRGSRVEPAHMASGGGGGLTVNVVGARDPKATAAEVVARIKADPVLRHAIGLR